MHFAYEIIGITSPSSAISTVTVGIRAEQRINGFSGTVLTFDVQNKKLEQEVKARVEWKIKQETGLDSDKYELRQIEPKKKAS